MPDFGLRPLPCIIQVVSMLSIKADGIFTVTDSCQKAAPQNKSLTGNGSDPSPVYALSIFS